MSGGDEEARAFIPVEVYVAVHDEVLRRWQYRCAVTGERFAPGAVHPHPHLHATAIRPLEHGGEIHVANFLPMVEEARRAWLDGTIGVGAGYTLLAVLDRLEPTLLERMRPEGRLLVPDEPAFRPDEAALRFHREHIFAR